MKGCLRDPEEGKNPLLPQAHPSLSLIEIVEEVQIQPLGPPGDFLLAPVSSHCPKTPAPSTSDP